MIHQYKIGLIVLLSILFSNTSAATTNQPFGGFIPQGTPTIDGKVDEHEWQSVGSTTLYKFFGEDSKFKVSLMWDTNYLYVAAEIEDYELWIDNFNESRPWESTWKDDAFKLEIDPNASQDENIQANDRIFAINANGSAMRFDKGNGRGGTVGISTINSILQAVIYRGSFNDATFQNLSSESQKDGGFTVEVAISWLDIVTAEQASQLRDGYMLGLNFINIEDDTGGDLDPTYHEEWKRVFDEVTGYMGEEGHPANWAQFSLSSDLDNTSPAALPSISVKNTSAFSTQLEFSASGDNGTTGYASRYDIRYSTNPINETNWDQAGVESYINHFKPKFSGVQESIKLIGFQPSTRYYLGIKVIDEQNNKSSISTTSFTTATASSASDKGYLSICQNQRYFCYENGEPHIVIGDNHNVSWKNIRNFYPGKQWNVNAGKFINYFSTEGVQPGRSYLKKLKESGVNTIRIILESYDQSRPPIYLFEDVSNGSRNIQFNSALLSFLTTLLDEAQQQGISVIISPFDTFFYHDLWAQVPLSTAKGGPMLVPDDLFNPVHRDYLKAILLKLVQTVGNRKNILAWELLNEFDNDRPTGWNQASYESRKSTINDLATYMHNIDPHRMVFASSVRWDPRDTSHSTDPNIPKGDYTRLVLNNENLSFNSTHTYYNNIRDISYNHPDNHVIQTADKLINYQTFDLDNSLSPAVSIKQGIQYYYARTLTPKPYLNSEYGPLSVFTNEYNSYFTEADDEQFFHNMLWSSLASGEVGTSLRWPGDVRQDHLLSSRMREYQRVVKNFIARNLDFRTFMPVQIGQDIAIFGTPIPIIKTGITDGQQGIIFLLKDNRKHIHARIEGAQLSLPGLNPLAIYNIEFWDSYNPDNTAPTHSISVTSNQVGNVLIDLPRFDKSQVIKFYKTGSSSREPSTPLPPVSSPGGYKITDDLWLQAIIHTQGKTGDIKAKWKKGGDGLTARGDRVIWGYFYADSTDVSWGSANNPDAYVKIWFDISGRIYVSFFHVSVPDITVMTDYKMDGNIDEQGRLSLSQRYIQHTYDAKGVHCSDDDEQNESSCSFEQFENGLPVSGIMPAANPPGNQMINNLRIGAVINTIDAGPINAIWHLGGVDTTTRGDRVVWGFYHASPEDVSWGSAANPDLFVKIWFDVNGPVFVNSFHVSVPDIEFFSDYNNDGTYDQQGTTILNNRYIEHRY